MVHKVGTRDTREARIDQLMTLVGLPTGWRDRRPGQLSGGGRQRVSIARALAIEPRILVADEPVSALDVSVQAQVLNLFADLQAELGLAYLFITHDLSVLARLADDIAVMYLGRVVEQGPAEQVLGDPAHPYTRALLAAAPTLGRRREATAAGGEMPDPINQPAGCSFHTRCAAALPICSAEDPETRSVLQPEHTTACHLYAPTQPAPSSS
jgi:oligopeptide/dipeptide ABC transporter ATP-binding protein